MTGYLRSQKDLRDKSDSVAGDLDHLKVCLHTSSA